jgi:hypothetical protein
MRRRVGAATLAAGLALAGLTMIGCSVGQRTATAQQISAVPGANADSGPAALRNALLAFNAKGYPAGSDAPLVVRLFNNGGTPLTLTGVTTTSAKEVRLAGLGSAPPASPTQSTGEAPSSSATGSPTGSAGPSESATPPASASPIEVIPSPTPAGSTAINIIIPAHGYVDLLPSDSPQWLVLSGLNQAVAPGNLVQVSFSFKTSDGQTLTMDNVKVPMAPPDSPEARTSVNIAPAE